MYECYFYTTTQKCNRLPQQQGFLYTQGQAVKRRLTHIVCHPIVHTLGTNVQNP